MRKMITNFKRDDRFIVAVILISGLFAGFTGDSPVRPESEIRRAEERKGQTALDANPVFAERSPDFSSGAAPVIIYPSEGLTADLDPCTSGPAFFSFEVSAYDESGQSVIPTVSSATGWIFQPQNGGNRYIGLFEPGDHSVVITATAEDGQTSQEDFQVIVTKGEPDEPNLSCIDKVNVVLEAGCSFHLMAENVLSGSFGCLENGDFVLTVQDGAPDNGNIIDGPGTYTYQIDYQPQTQITGLTGPLSPEAWIAFQDTATVNPGGGQLASAGFTDSTATLTSLGADLAAIAYVFQDSGLFSFQYDFSGEEIGFQLILLDAAGNPVWTNNGADGDTVSQLQTAPGWTLFAAMDGAGVQIPAPAAVVLSHFEFDPNGTTGPGFQTCWGSVVAEDKTPPTVDCPPDISTITLSKSVQLLKDTLRTADPVFDPAIYSCMTDLVNQAGGGRHYRLFPFTVSQPDVYTFELAGTGIDPMGALFRGDFDPNNPCLNIIAKTSSLAGTGSGLRMTLALVPGQVYTLWTSAQQPGATGPYAWTVRSESGGKVNGLPVSTADFAFDLLCSDLDMIYNNSGSYLNTGLPEPSDNCQPVTVAVADTLFTNGDCSPFKLNRTYTVSDPSGNTVTCTQLINFRRPALTDVFLPPFTAVLSCDAGFPVDNKGRPSPEATGYPFVETAYGIFSLMPSYCNLGASYTDLTPVYTCEGSYKFIRQWTLLNWCNPGASFIYNQIVKVADFSGPVIELPMPDYDSDGVPDLMRFSTGPFDCTAAFPAPQAAAADACSGTNIQLQSYLVPEGGTAADALYPNANGYFTGIPKGCHKIVFVARDGCGNESQADMPVWIDDQNEPVAICNEEVHATLNNDGNARLMAADLDEGSWDNCGLIRVEVRRFYTRDPQTCEEVTGYFSPWGPYVDLNCCDLDQLVRIELRVWDDRNGDGIPGNAINAVTCEGVTENITDNQSTCWLEVPVEDKRAPACIAPDAVFLDCTELPYGFDPDDEAGMNQLFGEPQATDNCPGATAETVEVVDLLNDCGNGQIIRKFRATDAHGLHSTGTCQQIIQVAPRHEYEIKFPKYAEANCGDPNPDTIFTDVIGCDLLAVNVYDERYQADADECYKLIRRYRVINWCEYDGVSSPVVISADEDCDNNLGDEAVWVLVRPNGVAYVDRDNQENNSAPAVGTSRCTSLPKPEGHWADSQTNPELNSVGFWEYTQVIRVYDNTPPQIIYISGDFCSQNQNCKGEVAVPVNVLETCTPDDVEVQVLLDTLADGYIDGDITEVALEGFRLKYVIHGQFPMGHHIFRVVVRDGCGNESTTDVPFDVIDCLGPTPVCINGLSAELSPVYPPSDLNGDGNVDNCAITVGVNDLIASPTFDCSPPVSYSLNKVGEIPDSSRHDLVLTYDDLLAGSPTFVEVHAYDAKGNTDYCQTYIELQDNLGLCSGDGSISGVIQTEEGEGVAGVQVNLNGNPSQAWTTPGTGIYLFSIPVSGYDYTVTSHLDQDPLNGVSTFDLVLMAKHILGIQLLNSPYKMIAADVNNSGSITTLDAIQLRKLILNIDGNFLNNTSWRFVPKSFVFPDPSNPWFSGFPEIINFNDLAGVYEDQDFVGIKIGDLNGSVEPNVLASTPRNSTGEVFYLETRDMALRGGETAVIDFFAPEIGSVSGFQGVLGYDPGALRIMEMRPGLLEKKNLNLREGARGRIAMSWNTVDGEPDREATGKFLFRLTVEAKRDLRLSDCLHVGGGLPQGEAYRADGRETNLGLRVLNPVATGFELLQNLPNPVTGETAIPFYIPEAGPVQLIIRTLDGRPVYQKRGHFEAGQNQFLIDRTELPQGAGVLTYTVIAGKDAATRKMILGN